MSHEQARDQLVCSAAGFESLLREALLAAGDAPASVSAFSEIGYTRSLYGLRLTLPSGAGVYLQIIAARAADERRSAVGTPPPPQRAAALPSRGPTRLTAVERHLVRALTARRDERIRYVEPLSAAAGSIPFGLRVTFHSGAMVCCNVAHAVPPGERTSVGGVFPSVAAI